MERDPHVTPLDPPSLIPAGRTSFVSTAEDVAGSGYCSLQIGSEACRPPLTRWWSIRPRAECGQWPRRSWAIPASASSTTRRCACPLASRSINPDHLRMHAPAQFSQGCSRPRLVIFEREAPLMSLGLPWSPIPDSWIHAENALNFCVSRGTLIPAADRKAGLRTEGARISGELWKRGKNIWVRP